MGSLRIKIINFKDVCDALHRTVDDVAKFLSKQFDAEAAVTDGILSIKKSLPKMQILSSLMQYRKNFV